MDSAYSYPDSVSSSPRSVGRASRGTVDSEYSAPHHHQQNQRWDQDQEPLGGNGSVRFMCSYGGRILPRPHDNQLRYVGGDTRIVAVARNISYSLLISKLSKLCGSAVTLKYQLPNEDLDALISVTTDEDLENMMDEYDRLQQSPGSIGSNKSSSSSSSSSSRLRLFLFPAKPESSTSSLGSLLESSKREHWFVDALNGVPVLTRGRSEVSSVASENPDYLFGLDTIEDWDRAGNQNQNQPQSLPQPQPQPTRKSRMFVQHGEGLNPRSEEEVHSAPASPVPDSSPYCSTSSAPPCMDSHVSPVEPLQAGGIETVEEGFEPLTSEGIADHETRPALSSPGLRTQDPRLVFDDHMTKIRPAEAFQQVQMFKQEPDMSEESQSQPELGGPMRRDGSGSSLASTKQEGSVSNPSDDIRNPHETTGGQLKQQESKYSDETTASAMMQQIPAEHYMEQPYAYPYSYPQPYWQVHDPHPDQAIPYYMLPTRHVPSAVRATGQPAGMPLQQMGPMAPITTPAVYSTEMLTTRSAVPPGPTITQKVVATQGPSYPAKPAATAAAPKVPMYRARPVVTDMRTMMRPSQPPVMHMPPDQYGYQQVVYETNPGTHVYYTQKAAVMMPQYQAMAPVTADLQASSEAIPEVPKLTRVSQSL